MTYNNIVSFIASSHDNSIILVDETMPCEKRLCFSAGTLHSMYVWFPVRITLETITADGSYKTLFIIHLCISFVLF